MTRKKQNLVVFDLDSTLTLKDTYLDFLIRYLLVNPQRWIRTIGLPFDVANFKLGRRNNSWLKQRFLNAVLGEIHCEKLDRVSRKYVAGLMSRGLRQSALNRLKSHQSAGDRIVLVTASFDFYVKHLAQAFDIGEFLATGAECKGERLTGNLAGANCYGVEKLRRLDVLLGDDRENYFITAYSDHHSDLELLQWADKAVVVAPSDKLEVVALENGWDKIDQ